MEEEFRVGVKGRGSLAPWYCELPHQGVLAVSGKDAGKLLQGQCTCDILGLEKGRARLGAFCNAKGRVIASFCTFQSAGTYYVLLPLERAEVMEQRLRRVILRAAATVENVSGAWRMCGAGGDLEAAARHFGAVVPEEVEQVAACDSGYVISWPGERLLIMQPADARAIAPGPGFGASGCDLWTLEDVRSGIPQISQVTSEEFVPQMINLDLLEAISFNKGCYIGQEIVARTHYLGRPKRRMFRLHCGEVCLSSGDALYLEGKPEQSVGTVVQVAVDGEGGQELLAVLALDGADGGILHGREPEGPAVSILPLPYTFP